MEQSEVEDQPSDIERSLQHEAQQKKIRIGILTISDRCSRGEAEDLSGPAIQHTLGEEKFIVAIYACVPDDRKLISKTLRRWADDDLADCIITTGGTGLSERDNTPEATLKVIDRRLSALSMHLALEGVKTVPTAVLSRGVAGVRSETLIVNLPGSVNGTENGARILIDIIPHAVDILRNPNSVHPQASELIDADL